jgi:hypothetical protein
MVFNDLVNPKGAGYIRSGFKTSPQAPSLCWDKVFDPPEADKSSKY